MNTGLKEVNFYKQLIFQEGNTFSYRAETKPTVQWKQLAVDSAWLDHKKKKKSGTVEQSGIVVHPTGLKRPLLRLNHE